MTEGPSSPWPTEPSSYPGPYVQITELTAEPANPLLGRRVVWRWTDPHGEGHEEETTRGTVVAGPEIHNDGEGVYLATIVVLGDDGALEVWRLCEHGTADPWRVKVLP